MKIYPTFFRLAFSWMDAELAHTVGFGLIKLADRTPAGPLLRRFTRPSRELRVQALGLTFPTPFGLAAGFDKNASGTGALMDLGFGHVEIGTVTGRAQPGNPKPRLFRLLEDRALINRMGFNNDGAAKVAERLAKQRARIDRRFPGTRPIVGVNIGKTKKVDLKDAIADYLISAEDLAPLADYLVVNVSSPNTPGLRLLQSVKSLRPLLHHVRQTADAAARRHVPLLVKIAPDLSDDDIAEVAQLVKDMGLDGVVATNTTITRDGLSIDAETVTSMGVGGLSGEPLKERSMDVLKLLRTHLDASVCIISVGGVRDAADVRARLDAGATLVQGYTAFLYEGPFWAHRINKSLAHPSSTVQNTHATRR